MANTFCDYMQEVGVHRLVPEETRIEEIVVIRQELLTLSLGVPVQRCPKCQRAIKKKPVKSFTVSGVLDDAEGFAQRKGVVGEDEVSIEAVWFAYGYE